MGAIFVFRADEPVWSWLFILLGPGATLLGVIVAAWRPRVGGWLLIALAIASTLVLSAVMASSAEVVTAALWRIALPMAGLGLAFLLAGRHPRTLVPKVSNGA